MKHTITKLFVIVMLFAVTSVYAIELGVKGGLVSADLRGGAPYWATKKGFCGGAFINHSIHNLLTIQLEVLYTQKGAKFMYNPFTQIGPEHEFTATLNYLEIPVFAKIVMPIKGVVQPNLFVGPYIAYNLTAKGMGTTPGDEDLDYLTGTDFGALFGVGLDFCLPVGKLVLDVRYTFGLSSIYEDLYEEDLDVKTSALSFMLGYSLRL